MRNCQRAASSGLIYPNLPIRSTCERALPTSGSSIRYFCIIETDFGQHVAFIIDAGANIGLTSVYLANRFPSARLLALEVDQQNFELLAANTRAYPRITPLLKGLWHRRANLVIDNPEDHAWAFTVSEASEEGSSTVEGISVADLLRDFGWERVDLLKLDIEGAELEVLSHGAEECSIVCVC